MLCGLPGHKAGAASCAEMQRTRKTLAKGPDGTYAEAVKAARSARVEAAKVTASSVAAGTSKGANAWTAPLPGTRTSVANGGAGAARGQGHQPAQVDQKMDRLERALYDMQTQMAMLMQIFMASQPSTAQGAALASQVQERDQLVASSLDMHD